MTIEFIEQKPTEWKGASILISGPSSVEFKGKQFLVSSDNGKIINLYEVRFEYACSPFKHAEIINGILAVGHQEHFYLFDLSKNLNVLSLKMFGYFGHLYPDKDLLYVADAGGIYCLTTSGGIVWENLNLGIDGVIITRFENKKIYGSGEWDPPGGWREFILEKQTGLLIEESQ